MKTPGDTLEVGQSLVEYSLLLLLIAVIVIGGVWFAGLTVSVLYGRAATELQVPTEEPTPHAAPTPTPESVSWEEWYEERGSGWHTQEDQYCQESRGEHRSSYGAENWSDYLIGVKAILYRGNGFGIYFRATDVKHADAYIFQYDPGWSCYGSRGCFIYRKIVGGRERYPFATASPPAGYEWHGVVRDFEVRVEGDTFITFIDGDEVLRATDSEYAHGQVGLRTWDSSEVCFSQFHVSLLKDPDRGRDDRDLESERAPADRLLK